MLTSRRNISLPSSRSKRKPIKKTAGALNKRIIERLRGTSRDSTGSLNRHRKWISYIHCQAQLSGYPRDVYTLHGRNRPSTWCMTTRKRLGPHTCAFELLSLVSSLFPPALALFPSSGCSAYWEIKNVEPLILVWLMCTHKLFQYCKNATKSYRQKYHLLSHCHLARLILRPWRRRRYVLGNVGWPSTDYRALQSSS
jgi:hypothetical protein